VRENQGGGVAWKNYTFIIDEQHRWSRWGAPKKPDGSFDHDTALTGDDLIDYVNREWFVR
jgi:type I restriction enzyme M protein